MNTFQLPVRPYPIVGESAGSFLLRTTMLNGYDTIFHLCKGLAHPDIKTLTAILKDPIRYAEIISYLGLDSRAENLPITQWHSSFNASEKFISKDIPNKFFRKDLSAYCPKCLKNRNYWRRNWLIKFYKVCTVHKVILLEVCSKCNSDLSVARSKIHVCGNCGFDLRKSEYVISDSVASEWVASLVDSGRYGELQQVVNFYHDLRYFKADIFEKINIINLYFTNNEKLDDYVLALLEKTAKLLHPRIQLLPFLMKKKGLHIFAQNILRRKELKKSMGLTIKNSQILSKSELSVLLNISPTMCSRILSVAKIIPVLHRKALIGIKPKDIQLLWKIRKSCYIPLRVYNYFDSRSLQLVYEKTAISEVMKILGVSRPLALSLASAGLLEQALRVEINGDRVVKISHSALEKFRDTFIFEKVVAAKLGIRSSSLKAKLRWLGIFPVSGPSIDGLLVNLYRISDVTTPEVQNLLKEVSISE